MPREFMPILKEPGFRLPWALIAPHEGRALKNHDQTLERLAQRGGLSFTEAYAVLTDKDCSAVKHDEPAQRAARAVIEKMIAEAGPVYVPVGGFVEDGGRWGKVSGNHVGEPDVVILYRRYDPAPVEPGGVAQATEAIALALMRFAGYPKDRARELARWSSDHAMGFPVYAPPGAARTVEDCPELNLSNYDADDVARLNDWAVRADAELERLTKPVPSAETPR
jgi:hypothetical protein